MQYDNMRRVSIESSKSHDLEKMLIEGPGSSHAIVLLCGSHKWIIDTLDRAKKLGYVTAVVLKK